MSKSGPIILIDDDTDECELMHEAFKNLDVANKLICFHDGQEALDFLKSSDVQPFLILTDINMPRLGGLELRALIELDPVLKDKSIPFIFFTTSAASYAVRKAYEMSVQGFFEKSVGMQELEHQLKAIVQYWLMCRHPRSD